MSSPAILILGAAHVQLDLAEVAHKMGLVVHVAAREPGPAGRAADHFTPISITEVSLLRDYVLDHDISVVYSSGSDLAMPVVEELSTALGLPHFNSPMSAISCNIKSEWREQLRGRVGQVRFEVLDDPDAQMCIVPYPAIVKPVDGQGQRGVQLVSSASDLRHAIQTAIGHSRRGAAIVEEYVEGPEISVNGYLDNGDLVFLGVTDRATWQQHLGLVKAHHYPSAFASDALEHKLGLLLADACRSLGIARGPVYAQLKMANGEDAPKLIEITPRFDGCHLWQLWERVTGVNLLRLALCELLDDPEAENLKTALREFRPPVGRRLVLGFECQEPGSRYQPTYLSSGSTIKREQYYAAGDLVKPVNGRFDKTGYWLEDLQDRDRDV